jgi:hypothetical protein
MRNARGRECTELEFSPCRSRSGRSSGSLEPECTELLPSFRTIQRTWLRDKTSTAIWAVCCCVLLSSSSVVGVQRAHHDRSTLPALQFTRAASGAVASTACVGATSGARRKRCMQWHLRQRRRAGGRTPVATRGEAAADHQVWVARLFIKGGQR